MNMSNPETEPASLRVSAIVPAYNEEGQLANVLTVLTTYPGFLEIIVVDDGSKDKTGEIAQSFPVRYIRNETNLGKGGAMALAVSESKGDILFFCDADLTNLTHEHIRSVIEPVTDGTFVMNVGMHDRAMFRIPGVLRFTSKIGGERALVRKIWERLPGYYKTRFRIELGLNAYAREFGKTGVVLLHGIGRVKKEQKSGGFWDGLFRRFWMFGDLIQTAVHLKFARKSD